MRGETFEQARARLDEWAWAFHREIDEREEMEHEARAESAWLRHAERPDYADRDEYPSR